MGGWLVDRVFVERGHRLVTVTGVSYHVREMLLNHSQFSYKESTKWIFFYFFLGTRLFVARYSQLSSTDIQGSGK